MPDVPQDIEELVFVPGRAYCSPRLERKALEIMVMM
jgi:hypothetical protein